MPDTAPSASTPKPRQRRSTPPAHVVLEAARVAALPTQRKVGRPSAYHPDLCERAIALGKQGKSRTGIAAAFHIDRATINKWDAEFPEFSNALARAKAYEQQWWEDRGQKSLGRKHFQSQVWRTSMAARFKEDYTEGKADGMSGFDLTAFVGALGAAIHGPGASAKVIDAQPVKDDAAAEPPPVDVKDR